MGRASNAKKAAREAREKGTVPDRPKRRWAYPSIVAIAVVLGVLAVWFARRPADTPSSNIVTPAAQTTDASVADATTTTVAVDPTTSSSVAP